MEPLTIGRMADLLGVSAGTLRAWERRHGLPRPKRSATGQRLYGQEELALLRQVKALMESGYSVGRAMERVKAEQAHEATAPSPNHSVWEEHRDRLVSAVDRFDLDLLDHAYTEALTLFPVDTVIEHVMLPALRAIGSEWRKRPDGIAREHFLTAYLRNKLGTRFHHETGRNQGRPILAACLPGEQHELGLMLFALAVSARGLRVLYLGPSLPLSQLPPVVDAIGAAAVVLSGTYVKPNRGLCSVLLDLSREMPCPVYVGGAFSQRLEESNQTAMLHPLGVAIRDAAERLRIDVATSRR